jgi:hypothetical protein
MNTEQKRRKPAYIQKREDAERKRKESKYESDRYKMVIALQRTNEQQDIANNRENSYESDNNRLEWRRFWLSVGTVVGVWLAAILTAVQAWIFYHTMTDARIAAGQQHTDTVTALSKTDTNIAALKEQSTTMHDQLDEMREERRAWVGPVSAGFPNGPPQVGKPSTVIVQYHNTGREPAIDVTSDLSPSVITIAEDNQGVGRTHVTTLIVAARRNPLLAIRSFSRQPGFPVIRSAK